MESKLLSFALLASLDVYCSVRHFTGAVMGFSPGDFDTLDEGPLHFEQKDRGIVLWNLNESIQLFAVDWGNGPQNDPTLANLPSCRW